MFKKTYEVTIKSVYTMDMVRALGKLGLKFEVSDEYVSSPDPDHVWLRDFIIHANKRTMEKLMKTVTISVN